MKGLYLRSDSPYYWIRYYDQLEEAENKRRKSLNTKIEVTNADRKRFEESRQKGIKFSPQGNTEIRDLLKNFKLSLAHRNMEARSGIKIRKDLKLSDGYEEYKAYKSVPGSKQFIKPKTLVNYDIAVMHMIKACGDKRIYKYYEKDYLNLLQYFEDLRFEGKKTKDKTGDVISVEQKIMSVNARSAYTRSLKALWNYFVDKNHAVKNIIEPVEQEIADPNPIPPDEMFSIISYLQQEEKQPEQYWIIYFMLLTGCRASSAIVQLKEDIDLKGKRSQYET